MGVLTTRTLLFEGGIGAHDFSRLLSWHRRSRCIVGGIGVRALVLTSSHVEDVKIAADVLLGIAEPRPQLDRPPRTPLPFKALKACLSPLVFAIPS